MILLLFFLGEFLGHKKRERRCGGTAQDTTVLREEGTAAEGGPLRRRRRGGDTVVVVVAAAGAVGRTAAMEASSFGTFHSIAEPRSFGSRSSGSDPFVMSTFLRTIILGELFSLFPAFVYAFFRLKYSFSRNTCHQFLI